MNFFDLFFIFYFFYYFILFQKNLIFNKKESELFFQEKKLTFLG